MIPERQSVRFGIEVYGQPAQWDFKDVYCQNISVYLSPMGHCYCPTSTGYLPVVTGEGETVPQDPASLGAEGMVHLKLSEDQKYWIIVSADGTYATLGTPPADQEVDTRGEEEARREYYNWIENSLINPAAASIMSPVAWPATDLCDGIRLELHYLLLELYALGTLVHRKARGANYTRENFHRHAIAGERCAQSLQNLFTDLGAAPNIQNLDKVKSGVDSLLTRHPLYGNQTVFEMLKLRGG